MSDTNQRASSHDERWGDHVPWSLRYNIVADKGDFDKFMSMLSIRLHTLLQHNEARIGSTDHFLARLITESFGRFERKSGETGANTMYYYFAPATIREQAATKMGNDPEKRECERLVHVDSDAFAKAFAIDQATRPVRFKAHWRNLIADRLEVLQSVFVLLQQDARHDAVNLLIRDIRRFAAESNVLLDLKGDPPRIIPIEEPLLQKEVIDKLLPRLQANYPERAEDLIKAYHDLLKGEDTNTVFGNAFKALEALARQLSGSPSLELKDRSTLEKHFPGLHGTIKETIIKLTGHRGDEGGHGRRGPDEYEIRYLLFTICNIALLLLEYKEHCG